MNLKLRFKAENGETEIWILGRNGFFTQINPLLLRNKKKVQSINSLQNMWHLDLKENLITLR